MRLPEPMLLRAGEIPSGGRWIFELKWDGFRGLVRTGPAFTVRSRRGWQMTRLLPELALERELVLDGEIVAFNQEGAPHFPLVSRRLLHGDASISVRFVVFDLLALDGESLLERPWAERRHLLEQLHLPSPFLTSEVFSDGEALFAAACEHDLEGIVAKRSDERYRPGERGWLKVKNRAYWRRPQELAIATQKRRQRQLI